MKFIFKKYIDFEKQHGTEEQLEHVNELINSYVEKDTKISNSEKSASIQQNLKKNLKI